MKTTNQFFLNKVPILVPILLTLAIAIGLILCIVSQERRIPEITCEKGDFEITTGWLPVNSEDLQWRNSAPYFDYAIEISPNVPEDSQIDESKTCRCFLASMILRLPIETLGQVDIFAYRKDPAGNYFLHDFPELEQDASGAFASINRLTRLLTFRFEDGFNKFAINSIEGGGLCIIDDDEGGNGGAIKFFRPLLINTKY